MTDWIESPLPEPLYGCADADCAASVSYPADMLRWFGGTDRAGWNYLPGWYCTELCADDISWALSDHYGLEFPLHSLPGMPEDADGLVGPTLAEEMARRTAVVAAR